MRLDLSLELVLDSHRDAGTHPLLDNRVQQRKRVVCQRLTDDKSLSFYVGFTNMLFVENVTDKSGAPGKWYFFSSQLLRNFAEMR